MLDFIIWDDDGFGTDFLSESEEYPDAIYEAILHARNELLLNEFKISYDDEIVHEEE